AEAQNERLEALDRANRAIRESASPQALAATPTQSATPSAAAPATTTPAPAVTKQAPAWVNPMPAGQISSCFGQRWGVLHAGVDLYTDAGEPIVSVGAGEVVAAGWAYSGYGISVVVDHGNGYLTHYAHMQADAVGVGQWVKAGDVLGYEGSTGDSTGPHLHFEVHKGMWNQIEPAQWLRDRGVELGGC
uniref:M23 family metallopeptidase n=1 Tax=Allorhizocola rhizosphaerae TaxID=1872709 RepID=UPI0013C30FDC